MSFFLYILIYHIQNSKLYILFDNKKLRQHVKSLIEPSGSLKSNDCLNPLKLKEYSFVRSEQWRRNEENILPWWLITSHIIVGNEKELDQSSSGVDHCCEYCVVKLLRDELINTHC